MYDPRFTPLVAVIYCQMSMFSPPLSDLTRDGTPYTSHAPRKAFKTVADVLLLLHCKYVVI